MKSWDNNDENESTAMNIAHLYLVKGNTEQAVEMYKRSYDLLENRDSFWKYYDEDFQSVAKYGITKEAYDKMREQIDHRIYKPNDKKEDN